MTELLYCEFFIDLLLSACATFSLGIRKLKSSQSENAALKADDNRQISQLKVCLRVF